MNAPSSRVSGVVLVESMLPLPVTRSLFAFGSLPTTDQGRGFCRARGVRRMPLPVLTKRLPSLTTAPPVAWLLMESLLGERIFSSRVPGLSSAALGAIAAAAASSLPGPPSVRILTSGDLRPTSGEYFSRLSVERERVAHEAPGK